MLPVEKFAITVFSCSFIFIFFLLCYILKELFIISVENFFTNSFRKKSFSIWLLYELSLLFLMTPSNLWKILCKLLSKIILHWKALFRNNNYSDSYLWCYSVKLTMTSWYMFLIPNALSFCLVSVKSIFHIQCFYGNYAGNPDHMRTELKRYGSQQFCLSRY